MKRYSLEKLEHWFLCMVVSMVFAFSSMAGVAAMFAVDIFAKVTPVIVVFFVILSILFFVILILRGQLESETHRMKVRYAKRCE